MESQVSLPLDIPNVEVLRTEMRENGDYLITVKSTQNGTNCKECGKAINKYHGQDKEIDLRHLSILGHRVYIRLRPLRYECPYCSDENGKKTTTQRLDWYNPKNSLTRAYEEHVLVSLVHSTVQDVSKKERTNYDLVRGVLFHRVSEQVNWSELDRLETIGIDEISLLKGRKSFVAIITARHSDGRIHPLAVLEERTKAKVKEFLESIPLCLRKTVHTVCTDMWEGYVNAAREVFGQQVSIVIDRFHVAKSYREAVDRLRKNEMKRLKHELSEDDYKQLKGVHWALRKNASSLNDDEIILLERLFSYSPDLKTAYTLREKLTSIFESDISPSIATLQLQQWKQSVLESGLKCFDSFLTTLANWFHEIVAYFERRLNSGFVEGFNNKIKVLKRRCYGILKPGHIFQRIYLDLNGFRFFLPEQA